MEISGFNPPIMCTEAGCDQEASVVLDRQNLETGAVTRDLYLCEQHAEGLDEPGSTITTRR